MKKGVKVVQGMTVTDVAPGHLYRPDKTCRHADDCDDCPLPDCTYDESSAAKRRRRERSEG